MCRELPSICEKIDRFERHIFVRQLRIAEILAEHFVQNEPGDELSQSAFVIIGIVLAYFEMIEQFASGESSDQSSPEFFKRGFHRVYPTPPVSDEDVRQIYKYFRCGMYHTAMPKGRCGLSRELHSTMANENGVIVINPARLVADLVTHCRSFCTELRSSSCCDLRRNFETMFDSFALVSAASAQATTRTTPAPWDLRGTA